jgi:hypothetical protein
MEVRPFVSARTTARRARFFDRFCNKTHQSISFAPMPISSKSDVGSYNRELCILVGEGYDQELVYGEQMVGVHEIGGQDDRQTDESIDTHKG